MTETSNPALNPSKPSAKLIAVLLLPSLLLLALAEFDVFAAPASPTMFTIHQPNGQKIVAKNQGDEWNNWVETKLGYTIAPDSNGVWYYVDSFATPTPRATQQKTITPQQPILTNTPAIDVAPTKLPKHIHPNNQQPVLKLNSNSQPLAVVNNGTTGIRNILFILAITKTKI